MSPRILWMPMTGPHYSCGCESINCDKNLVRWYYNIVIWLVTVGMLLLLLLLWMRNDIVPFRSMMWMDLIQSPCSQSPIARMIHRVILLHNQCLKCSVSKHHDAVTDFLNNDDDDWMVL